MTWPFFAIALALALIAGFMVGVVYTLHYRCARYVATLRKLHTSLSGYATPDAPTQPE